MAERKVGDQDQRFAWEKNQNMSVGVENWGVARQRKIKKRVNEREEWYSKISWHHPKRHQMRHWISERGTFLCGLKTGAFLAPTLKKK